MKTMHKQKAFTLVEILVVISITTILVSILIPALSSTRSRTQELICRSNLRQLLIASAGYATENDDFYVPAASDIWDNAGLHRWHGVRDNRNEPFDASRGPLVDYLTDGQVKECPGKVNFIKGQQWKQNFEQGCGGYGYNMTYIGSRLWQNGICSMKSWKDIYGRTSRTTEVGRPAQTVMFTDTAMVKYEGALIEYSFAEPPFCVSNGHAVTDFYMSPSIHFRHKARANVGWADSHIEPRDMAQWDEVNAYGINSADMNLGWFGPIDNTPFDLE